jgi:hypothetical protein
MYRVFFAAPASGTNNPVGLSFTARLRVVDFSTPALNAE